MTAGPRVVSDHVVDTGEREAGAPREAVAAVSVTTLLDATASQHRGTGAEPGGQLSTGFEPLDSVLGGGVLPGELLAVGGPPGVGKSVAVLQWARWAALCGHAVVFATYEQDSQAIMRRLLLIELKSLAPYRDAPDLIDLRFLSDDPAEVEAAPAGDLAGSERRTRLRRALGRLRTYSDRLHVVAASRSSTDVEALTRLATAEARQGRETALFVDPLHAVPGRGADPSERAALAADELKRFAMAECIPVVVVVSPDLPGLSAGEVRMHHLLGARALASEADMVLMLNRRERRLREDDPADPDPPQHSVVFRIEKHRRGPSAVALEYTKDYAHFRFDPAGVLLSAPIDLAVFDRG